MIRRRKDPYSGSESRASRLPPLAPPKAEGPVTLSLRDVAPPPPAPQELDAPKDDGLVISDSDARSWDGDEEIDLGSRPDLSDPRAARRAQVRRDRLQHAAEQSAAEQRAADERAALLRATELQAAEQRAAQARAAEERAAQVRAAQERAAQVRAEQARLAAEAAERARIDQARDRAEAQARAAAEAEAHAAAIQAEQARRAEYEATAAREAARQAEQAREAALRAEQARIAQQQAAEARAAAEREAEAKAAALRESEARAAAEAAARAAAAPPVPEVLVLGGAGATIQAVCRQLEGFGFVVRQLREPPDLPAPWPFAAVFVDRSLAMTGGGDAIDLCNHVRESSRLPGERKPVLMLVAEQLSATDKVRAGLAGCNELIVGEITRGAVAGALDRRGIVLPSDARRL